MNQAARLFVHLFTQPCNILGYKARSRGLLYAALTRFASMWYSAYPPLQRPSEYYFLLYECSVTSFIGNPASFYNVAARLFTWQTLRSTDESLAFSLYQRPRWLVCNFAGKTFSWHLATVASALSIQGGLIVPCLVSIIRPSRLYQATTQARHPLRIADAPRLICRSGYEPTSS